MAGNKKLGWIILPPTKLGLRCKLLLSTLPYMFLFIHLFMCYGYMFLCGVSSSFRVFYLWHTDADTAIASSLPSAPCSRARAHKGQPRRAWRVERSCSVVQNSQEDALWRHCKPSMPSVAQQSLLHPSCAHAAGKVLLQQHSYFTLEMHSCRNGCAGTGWRCN